MSTRGIAAPLQVRLVAGPDLAEWSLARVLTEPRFAFKEYGPRRWQELGAFSDFFQSLIWAWCALVAAPALPVFEGATLLRVRTLLPAQ